MTFVPKNGHDLSEPLPGDARENIYTDALWLDSADGRDSFVFLMDKGEPLMWQGMDTIADFNMVDDRIVLVSPEASTLLPENIQFSEDAQQLSIQWQHGDNSYVHSVEIRSHDGQLLSEMDILKAVQIL